MCCNTCEFWCGDSGFNCGLLAWLGWLVMMCLGTVSLTGGILQVDTFDPGWLFVCILTGLMTIVIWFGIPALDECAEKSQRHYKERIGCFLCSLFLVFLGSTCLVAGVTCATLWGIRASITTATCTTCNGQIICPVLNGTLALDVTSDYYRDVLNGTGYNSTGHNATGYNGTEYGPLVAHQYALFKDNLFMFFQIVAGTFPNGTEPGVNTGKCECDHDGGWSPSYKPSCIVTPEWLCNSDDPWDPKPSQDCPCGPDHTCTLRPTTIHCDCDDSDCGYCDCTGIPDGQSCNGTCYDQWCYASNPTCQSASCECESCTCEVTVHARKLDDVA